MLASPKQLQLRTFEQNAEGEVITTTDLFGRLQTEVAIDEGYGPHYDVNIKAEITELGPSASWNFPNIECAAGI